MQPVPLRLAQTIRTAFQTAKPTPRSWVTPTIYTGRRLLELRPYRPETRAAFCQTRFYSEKKSEIDTKVEEAKSRIDESIRARAENVETTKPDPQQDDSESGATIIHTNPEASSYVHIREDVSERQETPERSSTPHARDPSLPSSLSKSQSSISRRFSHLMDNLQSNIFTASQRLNDLTGYSGIEALKNDITNQETHLQTLRQSVKDARKAYQEAIATRSATQREVNDLLHRKHNWSPADLERFTSLYRSDHKNEQEEMKAQQTVSEKETEYEEASTKLARTILARYHEEQIWSDKIRQMSTWGTWGLMGLNVLLFVVFQIAIEPWRRARLVRGFEEKVKTALQHQDNRLSSLEQGQSRDPAGIVLDFVTGTDDGEAMMEQVEIEAAVEQATEQELLLEAKAESTAEPPSAKSGLAYYREAFRELFSDNAVLVSQRQLTTVALEGVAGGAAVMGLLFVLLRPK